MEAAQVSIDWRMDEEGVITFNINEIKNILDRIHSRPDEAEEWNNDLEDKVMEFKKSWTKERKENRSCILRIVLGNLLTPSSVIIFAL